MTLSKLPSVFDYLDLESYLQAYYKTRKKNDKTFSYEAWSQELKFNKNRSFIRLIVVGKKKASPAFIAAFCRMNFSQLHEETYFHTLVKYSSAKTAMDKQVYGAKLTQILRAHGSGGRRLIEDENFISSPFLPRLLTLVGLKDISASIQNYAQLMNSSDEEITKGLQTLEKLGLLKFSTPEAEKPWTVLSQNFKVPDNLGSMNLMQFHEQSLHDAIRAFSLPKDLRRYKSLFLVMSDEELQQFYKMMDEYSLDQQARFTSNAGTDKRIFQMNLNIHAVSQNPADTTI